MQDVIFRAARKTDCRMIAKLYSISSDGVADYIWTTLAGPGESILDVGQRRYEREGTPFSYENCTIVEVDGGIAGMLIAFPMHVDPNEPGTDDPVLAPYAKLEEDNSYYICGIAILLPFRGRGIGSALLQRAEKDAVSRGYDKTSLIVFEENRGAKRLYDRFGYAEVARAAIVTHPLIHHSGDAILMVKPAA